MAGYRGTEIRKPANDAEFRKNEQARTFHAKRLTGEPLRDEGEAEPVYYFHLKSTRTRRLGNS
jgi:hypothetical protein